jgi:hypothetical protein
MKPKGNAYPVAFRTKDSGGGVYGWYTGTNLLEQPDVINLNPEDVRSMSFRKLITV